MALTYRNAISISWTSHSPSGIRIELRLAAVLVLVLSVRVEQFGEDLSTSQD